MRGFLFRSPRCQEKNEEFHHVAKVHQRIALLFIATTSLLAYADDHLPVVAPEEVVSTVPGSRA